MIRLIILLVLISCGQRVQYIYTENKGIDGTDGISCDVIESIGGSLVVCGTSQVFIPNGKDGTDCQVIQDTDMVTFTCTDSEAKIEMEYDIVGLIDPCGDTPNKYDEVFLRLNDGSIVVYFEDGNNRRLSVITEGLYKTTDGTSCVFEIDSNGVLNDGTNMFYPNGDIQGVL